MGDVLNGQIKTDRIQKQHHCSEIIRTVALFSISRITTLDFFLIGFHMILSGECGEIFLNYFKEYLYQIFDVQFADEKDIPKDYLLNHDVSSFAETVIWWLKGHSDYTPEQVSELYRLMCAVSFTRDNTCFAGQYDRDGDNKRNS